MFIGSFFLRVFKLIKNIIIMSLKEWWETRKTIPKYIVNCTCDKDSSQNSLLDEWSFAHIAFGMLYSIPLFFLESYLICFIINLT